MRQIVKHQQGTTLSPLPSGSPLEEEPMIFGGAPEPASVVSRKLREAQATGTSAGAKKESQEYGVKGMKWGKRKGDKWEDRKGKDLRSMPAATLSRLLNKFEADRDPKADKYAAEIKRRMSQKPVLRRGRDY